MNARGQRALARRNRRKVSVGPREEDLVEFDTEDEDILEERDYLLYLSLVGIEMVL